MLKVKNRMPEAAAESVDAATSFIDQLVHDKSFRRKLRAAGKASAAASRRAQKQSRRGGIISLASDAVFKQHVLDAHSQLQGARRARKRSGHKAWNLVALVTGAGALVVATLKVRHTLAEKRADKTDSV